MIEPLGTWTPLAVVAGAVAIGAVLEWLVLPALYRRAKRRDWNVPAVVLESIRGVVVLWCAAAGLYLALLFFPLRGDEEFAANRALVVILIWSVTVVVGRVAVLLVKRYNEAHRSVAKTASLFATLTGIAVYAIGLLVVLQYLGISITPILTALGVGGLAVALALRDTLTNFFSGLQIIASDHLHVGDFVRLESGREGFVTDITWLHTTIRDTTNALIVVPNEEISSDAFTNLSLPTEQKQVSAIVNVAYGNDLDRVEAVTLEVADTMKDEFSPTAPSPIVRFTNAKDTGLELALLFHVRRYGDQGRLRHELYKRLFARYEKEGITLAHTPWAAAEIPDEGPKT
ncbi:MAG: mechanosensitive ion channel family protein [Vulcanimicrobiaceae bacterium]